MKALIQQARNEVAFAVGNLALGLAISRSTQLVEKAQSNVGLMNLGEKKNRLAVELGQLLTK